MDESTNVAAALDGDVLRKQSGEWMRYWDTEIRGEESDMSNSNGRRGSNLIYHWHLPFLICHLETDSCLYCR